MLTRSGRFLGTDRPRVWSPAGGEPRAGGGGAFLPRDAATPEAGKYRAMLPAVGRAGTGNRRPGQGVTFSNTYL